MDGMPDVASVVALIRELAVILALFGALLMYAFMRGRRAVMCLILGLYIALLISLTFPYNDALVAFVAQVGAGANIAAIIVFAFFALLGSMLFNRLLEDEYDMSAFEDIAKKVLLAALGTILLIAFSYHVLPISGMIDPDGVLSAFFAPESHFFWLLIIPLIGLLVI